MSDVVEKMVEAAEREVNADGEINLHNAMRAALDALATYFEEIESDAAGPIRAAILAAKG